MGRIVVMVVFAAGLLNATLLSAQDADYAGTDTCKQCHQAEYNSYVRDVHGNKLHPRVPANDKGCEACHGPMAKHVEAEGEGHVNPVTADMCLSCHDKGPIAFWHGSVHERHKVSCVDCHNSHYDNRSNLRAGTETEVCSGCHKDVRAQILRSSHHPIREGKMNCSDCHNAHGTVTAQLISANSINEKCYECHAEKRGPFLWEHPPVNENCDNCHVPHGSSHENLMALRTPFLCQQCHSGSRHPGTLYALNAAVPNANVYTNLNNRGFYRNCLNCHSQIHGSNHPSGEPLGR